MFTGLIDHIGEVIALREKPQGRTLRIATDYELETLALGASIACSGICLTVIAQGEQGNRHWFDVDAAQETLHKTTLGGWAIGETINLERAMRLGDALGGHMVSGHVDGVAELVSRDEIEDTARFTLIAPSHLSRFIAQKGSVTLDGTSLTVNNVDGNHFDVLLIPHTLKVTTWGAKNAGARINLEVDLIARHVARLLESQGRLDS
ncbi:MAG: riboflavin synthase [Pseudomonadota bacterium]